MTKRHDPPRPMPSVAGDAVPRQLTMAELESGLEQIRGSPADAGPLEMIVARPRSGERVMLEHAVLDVEAGLVGDSWHTRPNPSLAEQLTLMNSRVIALLARERRFWPLAGDQLYVDLSLDMDGLPPGARLALGEAVIEVSDLPHTGCRKFRDRFGLDALKFVSSPMGRRLQFRGINARVVKTGAVSVGDLVLRT